MSFDSAQDLHLFLHKSLTPIEAESGQILLYDDQTKTLREIASTTELCPETRAVEGVF